MAFFVVRIQLPNQRLADPRVIRNGWQHSAAGRARLKDVLMQQPNVRCPLCEAEFRCGVSAGDAGCWCFALPPVGAVAGAPAGRCVCKTCLERACRMAKPANPSTSDSSENTP
jgi:hypothetical protein